MPKQTITWTAIPNGKASETKLSLSVFVSPRLERTSLRDPQILQLQHFSDFINWPAIVKRLTFSLRFHDNTTAAAEKVFRTIPFCNIGLPSEDLWQNLFPANAPVTSHVFPMLDDEFLRKITSYPMKRLHHAVRDVYRRVAVEFPDTRPTRAWLKEYDRELWPREFFETDVWSIRPDKHFALGELKARWDRDLATQYRPRYEERQLAQLGNFRIKKMRSRAQPPSEREVEVRPFEDFLQYHHRFVSKAAVLPLSGEDYLDFHQAVSSLGDYPALLRLLGLVIDLEVPLAEVTLTVSAPQSQGWLRLEVRGAAAKPVYPRTVYLWDGQRFAAAPRANELVGGLLRLDEDYELVQVDLDGQTFKLMDTYASLETVEERATGDTPEEEGLPSWRSAGIALTRENHTSALRDHLELAHKINQKMFPTRRPPTESNVPEEDDLYAEDLVRGYRVDVWDSISRTWHSLCRRDGTYEVEGKKLTFSIPGEEGVVEVGWAQDPVTPGEEPDPNKEKYLSEALWRWDGWSLCVRQPGKSLSDEAHPIPEDLLLSHEDDLNQPVTPFKLKTSFTVPPGSLPRLRFGTDYRFRMRAVDIAGNGLTLKELALGFLFPEGKVIPANGSFRYQRFEPVNAPLVVMFKPQGYRLGFEIFKPGESLEHLVIRSFNNSLNYDTLHTGETGERYVGPPRTTVRMAETHGRFDGPEGLNIDRDTYEDTCRRDAHRFKEEVPHLGKMVPVVSGTELAVPYLPDPLARGAALQIKGIPFISFGRHFGRVESWPNLLAFRLVLMDGRGNPEWDENNRVLTVRLPKGERLTIPYSCCLDDAGLETMGIWGLIRGYFDEKFDDARKEGNHTQAQLCLLELGRRRERAREGQHWMLTPSRTLTLVHAVQQPLGMPSVNITELERYAGETLVRLSQGEVNIHAKTTAKVDLQASWEEWVDYPEGPPPQRRECQALVTEMPLTGGEEIISGNRRVGWYDPENERIHFLKGGPGLGYPVHEFGDTKHRHVNYQAVSTSSFREYFPQGLDFTRKSLPHWQHVKSTARPAAPKVKYVIPCFEWERLRGGGLWQSTRHGGLRVYLERPWYSSGDDELLGVVLWGMGPELPDNDREILKPYITQWGIDPVFEAGPVPHPLPMREDFPKRYQEQEGLLRLEDFSQYGFNFTVAGYRVFYNAERQLWYSDIMIDTAGAYFPFIRLALARYQPYSVDGVELSPVVLADFAQVPPVRHVQLRQTKPNEFYLYVSGPGYTKVSLEEQFEYLPKGFTVKAEMRSFPASEFSWKPAPEVHISKPGYFDDYNTITLPSGWQSGQYRLVVREVEGLHGDDEEDRTRLKSYERLVFAETIEI